MYSLNRVTLSILEMFHCCTDALLFFMVVFKHFVIFLPFEHAKKYVLFKQGKKMTKMGREQQHAPSIQHIQILWNKKKKSFFREVKTSLHWPSSRSESFTKWRKKLLKALSMCYSF